MTFIERIACRRGEPRPIDGIAALGGTGERLDNFRRGGLSSYSFLDQPVAAQIRDLIADCMSQAIPDAIILVSQTLQLEKNHIESIGRMPQDLGIPKVYVYGTFLNVCNGFASALEIGHCFIEAGRYSRVLVISADKCYSEDRVLGKDFTILGDGAAACLLSAREGAYRIEKVVNVAQAKLFTLDPSSNKIGYVSAMVSTIKELLGRLGTTDATLLTNNYSRAINGVFKAASNLPYPDLMDVNTAKYGHCYSADCLFNLEDAEAEGVAPGGKYLLMSTGQGYLGGIELTRE